MRRFGEESVEVVAVEAPVERLRGAVVAKFERDEPVGEVVKVRKSLGVSSFRCTTEK